MQRIEIKHKENTLNDFTLPCRLAGTFPNLPKNCLCRHFFCENESTSGQILSQHSLPKNSKKEQKEIRARMLTNSN